MALASSLDLGTNTCLLLIAEAAAGAVSRVHAHECRIVRLGEKVDERRELQPAAMERTLACLRDYAAQVRAAGLDPAASACVATSQARDARNGAEFLRRVQEETGFRFQVISGDREAELTFRGALLPGMDPARTAVIDIGGGSTELMTRAGGLSIDMGGVRFTERYLRSDPVTDPEFWACQDAVDAALAEARAWRERNAAVTELVAVAGTPTTLAAWHLGLAEFQASRIDGLRLSRGDAHRMVEELKWRTVQERALLPGVPRGRADILLAGSLILWRAMELLGFPELAVSTRGLLFGALLARP
jgi:exopolyphosphatase / guanosine-5'-triphosphate,3'-diphosphate pyrophosphatase